MQPGKEPQEKEVAYRSIILAGKTLWTEGQVGCSL